MPKMSSTRRDELIKVLSQKVEQGKIAVRNVRREVHNLIRELEKAKKNLKIMGVDYKSHYRKQPINLSKIVTSVE